MRIRLVALILTAMLAVFGMLLQAQEPRTYDVFTQGGLPFGFTPDGRYIAVVSYNYPLGHNGDTSSDVVVNVYQVSNFAVIGSYDITNAETEFVAISYDTRLIAYVQLGGLYVLDTTTGETTQPTFNFYEFEELEFNPVNNLLAYVIGNGITVFDPTNPAVHYELFDDVYGGRISSVAWSPDGHYLAHGVFRGGETGHDVVVWDMTDLESPIDNTPLFALLGGEPVHVAWRDSDTLASFGSGGVSIFDVPTRSLVVFIPTNPNNLYWSEGIWSPDGTRLLASGGNGNGAVTQIWNVSNLPDYESIFYQEGVIAANLNWTDSGLLYDSFEGLYRDGEFLAPQLTATAQETPVIPSTLMPLTPAITPTATDTPTP